MSRQLDFICNYRDDLSEIIKDLTVRKYAKIMVDAINIAGKLVYFQPIDYNEAVTNELTPWKKAGITDFNMCHVFDIELDDTCNDYDISESIEEYVAIGSFTIGAIQNIYLYEERLVEVFASADFMHALTEQMNIKLSNYTKSRRRLLSYTNFEAIEVKIVDPLNATNVNIGSVVTTTSISTTDGEKVEVNSDGDLTSDTDSTVSALIAIVIVLTAIIIVCGIILFYKYKAEKDKVQEAVHNEIKEKVELNVYKPGAVQKNIQGTEGGIFDDEKSESENHVGNEINQPDNNKNKSLSIEGKGVMTKLDDHDEDEDSLDEEQNMNIIVNPVAVVDVDAVDIISAINETKGNESIPLANIE